MVVESVKQVDLIEVKVVKGNGTKDAPTRLVIQYWDHENNLVFEIDPIHMD